MKLSDYVVEFISQYVDHVFMVAGGGAMHLDDSVGKQKMEVPMLHEQAAAIAAEAYARIRGMGVCLVTTGPGGTNAITGVAGAWLESTPMLILSGQVKRADMVNGRGVRQYGLQELDIVTIVKSITKYAVTVFEPNTIRYHLERAIYEATTGRRGPVWLDIPLDVQSAEINPDKLVPFTTEEWEKPDLKTEVIEIIKMLNDAKRPALLIGNGARVDNIMPFIDMLGIPVLCTWGAMDIISHEHYLYFGCPGTIAQRGPNFILQNADVLLCIGARLDFSLTGFDRSGFAPHAKKIIVDIDQHELKKNYADLYIHADAGEFVKKLLLNHQFVKTKLTEAWRDYCFKVYLEYWDKYDWVKTLGLQRGDIIVAGSSGITLDELWLSIVLPQGTRMFSTMGLGAMGYAIPSAIGAALASNRRVVCIDGDGSFQLNIQELDTVRRLGLPIKFYYLNNGGYRSIQITQNGYFEGRHVGSEFTFPDINKIAEVYGVDITEIKLKDEPLPPRYVSKLLPDGSQEVGRLENLYPYLSDEEMKGNML